MEEGNIQRKMYGGVGEKEEEEEEEEEGNI